MKEVNVYEEIIYRWTCPDCECVNEDSSFNDKVVCENCFEVFKTNNV